MSRNIARLESNIVNFQNTYVSYENATDLPTLTPLVETPMVPTVTIAASLIPTHALTSVPVVELTADAMLSPSDLHLKSLLGQKVLFDLDGNVDLFADEAMTPEKKLGTVINYAQSVSGTLVGYTDKAVNLHAPFNIGRSQISISTYTNVNRSTNVRQFSDTPSATTPIFISQIEMILAEPASACTDSTQEFCHGTVSFWVPREKIQTTIR